MFLAGAERLLTYLVTFVARGAAVGAFVQALSGFAFVLTAVAIWAFP